MGINFVCFCDGSCRGNPGYAGSGVYGYTYRESTKHKNHKHPNNSKYYFTSEGILTEKNTTPIEVIDIVEIIKAINSSNSTNNEAELLAVTTALQKARLMDNLKEVTIYTDSNYIVTSFNENIEKWKQNNWKRIDGKTIIHINEWTIIDNIHKEFIDKGIKLNINWVKGHSDNYGNNIADLYSVIGSNAARQLTDNNTTILDQVIPYSEYKESFNDKDFMFFFRDLYFSSNSLDDTNYCFISNSEDSNILGKRNNYSIFVTNIGYVPTIINDIKKFYRSIERDYTTTCCIKICKLENKNIYRLTKLIDIKYFLTKISCNNYSLVGDKTPFLFENTINFPFIINASTLFSNMVYIDESMDNDQYNIIKKDITDDLIKDGKLKITNKDKFLDFTEKLKDIITLKQKLIIKIGYDIPNYLALKNIEKDIKKVNMIILTNYDNNFCTVYINIVTSNRILYSTNIENKYLALKR